MKNKVILGMFALLVSMSRFVGCSSGDGDTIDVPNADPSAKLAITSPASNDTSVYGTIIIFGVGMRDVASASFSVLTDGWYDQSGTLHVSDNNSWSFYPIYLDGTGQYNNHTIKLTVRHTDGTVETVESTHVVRLSQYPE